MPVFASASEITALTDVSTGGATIYQGDTVTRANLSEISSYWTFHFTWPEFVPNANAHLVIFKGTFGDVEGGLLEDGVNYSRTTQQWSMDEVSLVKEFSFALGNRSTPSGTYTAVVADTPDVQGFLDWFSSGGTLGVEPSNYSSITFQYLAEDAPENLTTAIESISVRDTVIHEGDEIYRDDLPALDISPNDLDRYWNFHFTWPSGVANQRALFMIFRGTFGDVEGGTLSDGVNYSLTFQQFSGGENAFGKYLGLPALKDPSTATSTYTIMIAERDSKYATDYDASEEALWFASGGEEGIPPAKYSFLTFDFEGDTPVAEPGITAPVIIIPGILGSAKKHGEWVIDPILHVYDNLIETLLVNGYQKDVTLFTFPYEWRDSNIDTAVLLKQKIDAVKNLCHCDQVDIVAHSMGGLVARQYIQSLSYEEDVRRLVFLGTPHLGSPQSYLTWEGGEIGDSYLNKIAGVLFTGEALEHGYLSLFRYLREKPIYSVQELLPVYSYLKNADDTPHSDYPNEHPRNIFLEQLTTHVDRLYASGVEITNIVGNLEGSTTISTIRVVSDPDPTDNKWDEGYPENFSNTHTDQGLELGTGDETVPADSAEFINSNIKSFAFSHTAIVGSTASTTFQALTLEEPATIISRGFLHRLLFFRVFSPVDFVVIAPDGKKIGKDEETGEEINEITDAFYAGFDTDDEFVTILDPLDGEYTVTTFGTGDGEYTLEASYIDDETTTSEFFPGTTLLDSTIEHVIQLNTSNESTIGIALPVPETTTEEVSTPTIPTSVGGGGGIIYQNIIPPYLLATSSTSTVAISDTASSTSPEQSTPPPLAFKVKGKVAGVSVAVKLQEENQMVNRDVPPKWYHGFVEIFKNASTFLSKIFTAWRP